MTFRISRRRFLLAMSGLSGLPSASICLAEAAAMKNKVLLLGDSILDNGAYVAAGADVTSHLRRLLPPGWTAACLAVDGSQMDDVRLQLERVPGDATHLVVSMGGNDALGVSAVLSAPSRSVAHTLLILADVREQFCSKYASTLDAILAFNLPTAICSIYDVRYVDPEQRRIALTALSILNDCITRAAADRGLPLIDLRVVCNEDADFANAIEPSEEGGRKIAAAIVSFLARGKNQSGRGELIVR